MALTMNERHNNESISNLSITSCSFLSLQRKDLETQGNMELKHVTHLDDRC